jgi:hypothetical protein
MRTRARECLQAGISMAGWLFFDEEEIMSECPGRGTGP